ncbi:MAG: DUF4381 family protein [Candidatus Aminicenantes bacterium]|nr:DUF4381 family protein [Candidatus Aminicenantes bacterium]
MLAPQRLDPQLESLIEIIPPQPVSYRPETVGWFVILGLLVLAVAWIAYRRYRHHRANQYRRWALEKLEDISQVLQKKLGLEKPLKEIPLLVKQTALHAYPREEVASLYGDEWLRFLDAGYGGTGFSDGPGRILAHTAYEPDKELERYQEEDIEQLLKLVRKWIKKHRSEA